MHRERTVSVAACLLLMALLGAPAGVRAQEAAASLTGLPGVEVSIFAPLNVEPVVNAVLAKLQAGRIPMKGGPALLRLNSEVARADTAGMAAFVVELQLTQLVDVRANGQRVLVPTWSRRRFGLADLVHIQAEVANAAQVLTDEFVNAWASVNAG